MNPLNPFRGERNPHVSRHAPIGRLLDLESLNAVTGGQLKQIGIAIHHYISPEEERRYDNINT